jgi:hypothetical protein
MKQPCAHWRTPVSVAGGTVLCSGWLARPDPLAIELQRGFYLDAAWRELATGYEDRITLIEWPDFGVIEPGDLTRLADRVIAALALGPVDIGCLGGHGRTGTLLAAIIGRAESLPAGEAILAARNRYCNHAVETPAQAALVAAVLGEAAPLVP